MEKQPTEEELEDARAQARADAEERAGGGAEPEPGEQPLAYAPEDVQAAYAKEYERSLARQRESA